MCYLVEVNILRFFCALLHASLFWLKSRLQNSDVVIGVAKLPAQAHSAKWLLPPHLRQLFPLARKEPAFALAAGLSLSGALFLML